MWSLWEGSPAFSSGVAFPNRRYFPERSKGGPQDNRGERKPLTSGGADRDKGREKKEGLGEGETQERGRHGLGEKKFPKVPRAKIKSNECEKKTPIPEKNLTIKDCLSIQREERRKAQKKFEERPRQKKGMHEKGESEEELSHKKNTDEFWGRGGDPHDKTGTRQGKECRRRKRPTGGNLRKTRKERARRRGGWGHQKRVEELTTPVPANGGGGGPWGEGCPVAKTGFWRHARKPWTKGNVKSCTAPKRAARGKTGTYRGGTAMKTQANENGKKRMPLQTSTREKSISDLKGKENNYARPKTAPPGQRGGRRNRGGTKPGL